MIRVKDELVNFPPIDLDALTRNGKKFPEHVNGAVSLYNKAIDRIKFNSSDIAVIELKKAIKLFPEFYDAILLLSLCYYADDDKTKAINLLNTIRDEEERNKCFHYLDSVVGKNLSGKSMIRRQEVAAPRQTGYSGQRQISRSPVKNSSSGSGTPHTANNRRNNYNIQRVLSKILNNPLVFRGLVVVIALMIIIGLALGLYTIYNVNNKTTSNNARLVELETNYNSEKQRADKATEELKSLKSNDEELIEQYLLPILLEKYTNRDTEYENIIKMIYLMDTSVLTNTDSLDKINAIQNEVLLIFGDRTFANAQNDIVESKYADGIAKYESLIKYYPSYSKITTVMLELGKAYIANENAEAARTVLTELVEYYGTSLQATEAKELLAQLG